MPIGICGFSSASFRSISAPVLTTSFSGSVETPIPMARRPLTRISVPGGSGIARFDPGDVAQRT